MKPRKKMAIENTARDYFAAFSEKDLNKLKKMFAVNVSLRDWEIYAFGHDEVCQANQKIFDSVVTINVDPINIYTDSHTVIGDLIITINGKEIIRVVDILDFDQDLKIISIKAYKG
jgi:hypothetical protein